MEPTESRGEQECDEDLVLRVLDGDVSAFAVLMRRYNRRLFRIVRAVVRDDAEAEDVCQEAWLRGYRHREDLEDGAKFSMWLSRIAWRYALARVEKVPGVVAFDEREPATADEPFEAEEHMDVQSLAAQLECAIDRLPASYRAVVLLRDLEHLSTTEVAALLDLTEENVRVRLHRARANLRRQLTGVEDVFRFDGERCLHLTRAVLARVFGMRSDQSDSRYATKSAVSHADSSSPNISS